MPQINYIATNFTNGELSPQLDGRVDLAKYANSAATMNNIYIKPFGGAYRRPGTYLAGATKLSTHPVKLIPFQFSTEQAYIVEAGHQYMRFYKDGGIITSGSVIEISTPYDETDLFELQFAQNADTMYITHNDYPTRKLTRSSHYLWSLAQVDFRNGPLMDDNTDENHGMWATAVSGHILITSQKNYFETGHSGSVMALWAVNITKSIGIVQITDVNSATTVSANTVGILNNAGGYTWGWAMGAWNEKNGYPAGCSFFEQRFWAGGSKEEPQNIRGSVSLDYENFFPGPDNADACAYTIGDNQVNAIRWIAGTKILVIGTMGGNFSAKSDSTSGPITPSNIMIKRDTTYGSALLIPKKIGNYVYYMQRNNRTLRELGYDFEQDAQVANDTTMFAEHITESGIVDMDFQESPNSILWCIREDGRMATMTRYRSQDVLGWSMQETQGSFCAVATIANGEEDQVWVVVQRSVAAGLVKFIEYFKPFNLPDDQDDCFFVDSGLTYQNTATQTQVVTGLDHLAGRTVSILGDGAVYPNCTVSSNGSLTITKSCNTIHIGLPYTSIIKTVKLEAGSTVNTTQGLIKRIYEATVRLWRSLGCQIGTEDTQDTIYFRTPSDEMDEAVPLFTGDKRVSFPAGYTKKAQVYITQSQPLPLNILAVISKVSVEVD